MAIQNYCIALEKVQRLLAEMLLEASASKWGMPKPRNWHGKDIVYTVVKITENCLRLFVKNIGTAGSYRFDWLSNDQLPMFYIL